MRENNRLSISVVIPTVGRADVLTNTIRDLCSQKDIEFEILVVNQGTEGLESVKTLLPPSVRCRCFYQKEPNASLARNVGLLEANSPYVLFLDDDIAIGKCDFLKAHATLLKDQNIGGVCGQILLPDQKPRNTRHWMSKRERVGWLYHPANYNHESLLFSGMAGDLSVRREQAIQVGGMDSQFIRGAHREESDFCLRLVKEFGPILFTPNAGLVHIHVQQGGCREWNSKSKSLPRGLYAPHHYAGEWYFIRRGLALGTIKYRELPDYLFVAFRRQIWNSHTRWRPSRLWPALRNSLRGCKEASRMLHEGPKYLDTVTQDMYELLWDTHTVLTEDATSPSAVKK